MKISVIGSGAREHVLARELAQSQRVETVYCLPGNPGMTLDAIQTVAVELTDFAGMIDFAQQNAISYTIVGPEQPLVAGIVDAFQTAGLTIFGPTKAAAALEGSKTFAKEIMAKAQVPTAGYQTFTTVTPALAALAAQNYPVVIKADGLAAGKGVVIAPDLAGATTTIERFFEQGVTSILIEDYLSGEEFSLMALVADGQVYPLPVAQDHKRAFEGDLGPNTGGMGAYCPVPQVSAAVVQETVDQILQPVVAAMADAGTPFTGVLYAGLIATKAGVKVIEFNVRFGDPETQVVLPRMTGDWAQVFEQLVSHQTPTLTWQTDGMTLGVVVAAEGYPTEATVPVELAPTSQFQAATSQFSFAGVAGTQDQLIGTGGRLLTAVVTAIDLPTARQQVYADLKALAQPGTFYRQDIGHQALT